MRKLRHIFCCALFSAGAANAAPTYPLTVQNCGKPEVIDHKPTRAVFHDVNEAEMAFALTLQPFMAGVSGISGWSKGTRSFQLALGNVPEIAPRYPSLEQLVASKADLFVGGWNYGMRLGGDVTPETLAAQGIPVVILSESCMRAGGYEKEPDMELLYGDEQRLGVIFDRSQQADVLIADWKNRVNTVHKRVGNMPPVRVFVFDSGRDRPFTAGHFSIASVLIKLGGGQNIFADLNTNWGAASWEEAAIRDPEVIVIVDYGKGISDQEKFLVSQPLMAGTSAVRNHRFLRLSYDEITPAPADIDAVEQIAAFLHPQDLK